jgi:hypothetical protein
MPIIKKIEGRVTKTQLIRYMIVSTWVHLTFPIIKITRNASSDK